MTCKILAGNVKYQDLFLFLFIENHKIKKKCLIFYLIKIFKKKFIFYILLLFIAKRITSKDFHI